jgi:hypothetical protein
MGLICKLRNRFFRKSCGKFVLECLGEVDSRKTQRILIFAGIGALRKKSCFSG